MRYIDDENYNEDYDDEDYDDEDYDEDYDEEESDTYEEYYDEEEEEEEEEEYNDNRQNNSMKIRKNVSNAKKISSGLKKGFSVLKQGIAALGKAIMAILPYLPYILIAVVILILIIILLRSAWDFVYETKGTEQSYQTEDSSENNTLEYDSEKGAFVANDLSMGNKLVKAFYTYYSEKSLYVTVTDVNGNEVTDKPIQYNSPEFVQKFGTEETRTLKDKYEREKMFYTSPNVLWTLDQYLNNGFLYPEQFIKPVPYDKDTYELKNLTDDNGKLVIESQKYKKEGDYLVADGDKKVKGIWDYGFGSILHYKEYEEKSEARAKYETTIIWDVENQKGISLDINAAKILCEEKPDKYQGYNSSYEMGKEIKVEGNSNYSYMIDRVTSPAGFIENTIKQEWVDSGRPYTNTVEYEMKVDVKKTREVQVKEKDPNDNNKEKPVYQTYNGLKTFNEKEYNGYTNKPIMKTEEYYEKENKILTSTANGTYFDYIPVYEGVPDTSKITGNRYYQDYLANYKTYVPNNVMSEIGVKELKKRTDSTTQDLLKLLERESFGTSNSSGGGSIDTSSFQIGSGGDAGNFTGAIQYLDKAKEIGEKVGVDPYLIIAIIANESGGDPNADNGSAYGLMQYEYAGNPPELTLRYTDGTTEKLTATKASMQGNIELQIKLGCAELQQKANAMGSYNPLIAAQAYNCGEGALQTIIKHYISEKNLSKTWEDIVNELDLGWMEYRQWYTDTYKAATPQYLERICSYYISENGSMPWLMDPNGNKVYLDNSILPTGSGTLSGVSKNWLKGIWDKFKNAWNTLFPNSPSELSNETIYYKHKIREDEIDTIIKLMFAMEDQELLSKYEDFSDEDWKNKFSELFSNPLGTSWSSKTSNQNIDPSEYFSDGYTCPVDISSPTISKEYSTTHKGIDITVPEGTDVKAIADGEIIKIDTDTNRGKYIQIKHDNGVYTLYGSLSETKVKEGDKVKKGAIIGKSGSTESKNTLHIELSKGNSSKNPTWIITGTFSLTDYNLSEEDRRVIENILNLAATKVGCRYTQDLGYRTGPNSFDCSGLTWWLYNKVLNINIGLNTWEQESTLQNYRVNPSDIQPGDLLMANDQHHVVLYVGPTTDGRYNCIEAANSELGVIKNIRTLNGYHILRPIAYYHTITKK